MCGISGSLDFSGNQVNYLSQAEASLKAIAHRGPDDRGIQILNEGVLAQVRLGILDPGPSSHQPFVSADNRYYLIYNGEIFNFRELRLELQALSVEFKTEGDTEVLFNLLIREGKNALHKLNGFFAFAFYDRQEQKLLLARDRFGIKPLFYFIDNKQIAFSSEMRGLLAFKSEKNIDTDGVKQYFRFGYIPAPQTVIEKVKKLRPGFLLTCEKAEFSEEQYFTEKHWKNEGNPALAELLEDAVKMRLVADRPLGCFLSGGIDSSIITALAAKHKSGLKTFSVSFPEFEYIDEGKQALAIANHLGTNHSNVSVSLSDLKKALPDFLNGIDMPFADSSALAVWMLSKKTTEQVKVVLSGDGADELFAGYRKHRAALMFQQPILKTIFRILPEISGNREGKLSDLKRKIGRLSYLAFLDNNERILALASFADITHLESLFTRKPAIIPLSEESAWSKLPSAWMQKVLEFDRQIVLADDMLYKTDFASMAHGLEVRCPYLDYRLVNLVRNMPVSELLNFRKGKLPLRQTFGHLLPDEVFSRPKRGFEIPLSSLMQDLPSEWNYRFEREFVEQQGIFNWQAVTNLAKPEYKNAFDQWAYLIFQAWYVKTFKTE